MDRQPGDAGPAGSPGQTTSASASTPAGPSTASAGPLSEIRKTDWHNVTIRGLKFCGGQDEVTFRKGIDDYDPACMMLPDEAQPVYADILVEEPANRPATEDALVLVAIGGTGWQALLPIQIDVDGKTRIAWPAIENDPSRAADYPVTFTSYRVENADTVVATVKTVDGKSETRQYRQIDASGNWERF